MATGQWPTLNDVASRVSPDGKMKLIAEYLSQANEILEDMNFIEASEIGGHTFGFRTSIPGGDWTAYNQGVPTSKSTTAQGRVALGRLEAFSQIDLRLADDCTDPQGFRLTEDVAFMQGMSQTMVQNIFYGNTAVNPYAFIGFSTFYGTINPAIQPNAANVFSGGGTGSSNTSLWLLGWGENTISALYPRGSKAGGLKMRDLGDSRFAYDSVGNPFLAYTTHFEHVMGICPKDWQYGSRYCNLDTTSAGLFGPNAADLFVTMDRMVLAMRTGPKNVSGITKVDAVDDPAPGNRQVFYGNRTLRHAMDTQALRNRNVLIRLEDYAGMPVMSFRGLPIKIVDQLVNTEATVV